MRNLCVGVILLIVGFDAAAGFSVVPSDQAGQPIVRGRSYVELVEPATNTKVVLVGCLHGSVSSADDVRHIIEAEQTDIVVLELCASRFADLQRQQEREEAAEEDADEKKKVLSVPVNSFFRFISMVIKTNKKRGLPTAVAAAILSGASGLQTGLSGFRPGLEFLTATHVSQEQGCDIVLADRAVDETLRRMGTLPTVSLSMLAESVCRDIREFDKTPLGKESEKLSRAVFGDNTMDEQYQLSMMNVLTRNADVLRDLARVTLPIMLFAQLFLLFGHAALSFVETGEWMALDTLRLSDGDFVSLLQPDELKSLAIDVAVGLLTTGALLTIGYVVLALPAARVILSERDEYLTQGIKRACQVASSRSNNTRVVAVLGLLHVNGIAQRLLDRCNDSR